MNEKDFFKTYCKFVDDITSNYSKDDQTLAQRTEQLSTILGGNFARLDTAVAGLSGECGEIADLWKKIKFHGKEFTANTKEDLVKELGDVFWYLAQASIALDVSMEEIINQNVKKLSKRHPNGFDNLYMKNK